jgi:hypothetical protein
MQRQQQIGNELHLQHRKVLASPGSRAAYAPMAAY